MKIILILATLTLTGCGSTDSLKGKFQNRVGCSVAGDKAFVISEYGPVGIASTIADADAAVICPKK